MGSKDSCSHIHSHDIEIVILPDNSWCEEKKTFFKGLLLNKIWELSNNFKSAVSFTAVHIWTKCSEQV